MWISREITKNLRELVSTRPAVVVTGARQVGKTSLLVNSFPTHHYASLELPIEAARAAESGADFIERQSTPLIIDEVQYAPELFRYLKYDIDQHRKERGRFLITGSQKFLLMRGVTESLAGRAGLIELHPLSASEIFSAYPDYPLLELIYRGGYPELYEDLTIDPSQFYSAYVAMYLERDVRSLLSVGSLRDFERFIRACALRTGQLLNKSELARDVGISSPTAAEWISVLEASNQITLLEPWFSNRTRSIVKTPKLYLNDTGLLCLLLGITSPNNLLTSPLFGAIWETFVHNELRKRAQFAGPGNELFFWRDRNVEVDFLIHRGGNFQLFEAKASTQPSKRDTESLKKVRELLAPKQSSNNVVTASIIARNAEPYALGDEIQALSLNTAWLEVR